MSLWFWLAVPLVGLLLGLFGAGGGMLTVPLLIYGAGLDIKAAIAASVWIVAAVSLIAALQQRAWRVLQWKLLIFFAAGGLLGGSLGAWSGAQIPAALQQLLFAALLLVVAGWTSRLKVERFDPLQRQARLGPGCRCGLAFIGGIALGFVTGLLGVGGGFLMVPVLLGLGISYLPTAVAHSLVLIAANATVAGIIYQGSFEAPWRLIAGFIALASAGAFIGKRLLHDIDARRLQMGFSAGLALLGIAMLLQLAASA